MRRRLVIFFTVILIVIATLLVLWQISKSRSFQFFGGIVQRVDTDDKVVALTFDDGPTKENTDKMLSVLKDADIKATFFVIGDNLEANGEEGKKIAAAGHELGNHSYSHHRMVFKSPSFIRSEIERTDNLIRLAGYKGEIQFRPPNGKKLIFLPYYLKQHNRKTILWNLEPDSISEGSASSEDITEYVVDNVKPGSIILLHVMYDSRGESLKAVEEIVNKLKNKGYTFKTVSELLKMDI